MGDAPVAEVPSLEPVLGLRYMFNLASILNTVFRHFCTAGLCVLLFLFLQLGLEGIPASWSSRTLRYESVLEHAKKITSHHK